MPSKQNQATVTDIKDRLSRAKSVILADYSGISVADQDKLRASTSQAGGQFTVFKNRLFKIAVKDFLPGDLPRGIEDALRGQTAFLFSYEDAVSALKALYQFAGENENLEIKIGILDGKVLSPQEVEALSKLPSRKELIARLIGQLNAPISGFATVLSGTTKKLVYALNAIKDQKEKN